VNGRRLIGFGYAGLVSVFFSTTFSSTAVAAEKPRAPVSTPVKQSARAGEVQPEDPIKLVREVVYNEQHDHDAHGYWRYWIERHSTKETRIDLQVETPDGPITRAATSNGRPLSAEAMEAEDRRLEHLLSSPSEHAQHRKEYAEDERRIARILVLLPDAFIYEPAQEQRLGNVACYHLRFRPNPAYPAHSIESRIFHAMAGDLWIGTQDKRLVRLDGQLQENVDFGYGILGRLYKNGWFRLERTSVISGNDAGDWKTQRLEVHMQGRAIFFKTIARETSEVRGGFTSVPAGLSLAQAAVLLRSSTALASGAAHPQPVALVLP